MPIFRANFRINFSSHFSSKILSEHFKSNFFEISSLKRASQLDPNRRRSTRKIAENKHVSVTKKKVDEIIVKEPRVSQYLKIEHDNRRKGSNSLIWTVSEKTVNATVSAELPKEQLGQCLLVWAQETAEK